MTADLLQNVNGDLIRYLKLPLSVQNLNHPRNILVIRKLVQNLNLLGKEYRHVELRVVEGSLNISSIMLGSTIFPAYLGSPMERSQQLAGLPQVESIVFGDPSQNRIDFKSLDREKLLQLEDHVRVHYVPVPVVIEDEWTVIDEFGGKRKTMKSSSFRKVILSHTKARLSDDDNCCMLCIRAYSTSTSRHSNPRQNKRETNASPHHECFNDTDCGKNAVCDISGTDTDNVCVCKPGFFDNPPTITTLSDGCPGECGEFGETDQCKGNTLCTQTPQGYGLCTCPENTYGPPKCLAEGSTTTEKSRRNLILVYGALTIPLLFLVPAALASGLSLG
uniref:Uncharacterized protein n=1 Tax=Magallana gigas TaxID=29159 RepID=A0A8W8NRY6_MAGGI